MESTSPGFADILRMTPDSELERMKNDFRAFAVLATETPNLILPDIQKILESEVFFNVEEAGERGREWALGKLAFVEEEIDRRYQSYIDENCG